jgi:Ca2+/Na+ antiporter
VKDKEFAGQKRFVPYLSSRFIGPAALIAGLLVVTYVNGIYNLNQEAKGNAVKISSDKFEKASEPDKYDALDFGNLLNGEVYRKGLATFANLFGVETKTETMKVKFKSPSTVETYDVSPNEKLIYEDAGSGNEIRFTPNASLASTERSYFLWITPWETEHVTKTPSNETVSVETAEGAGQVSAVFEEHDQKFVTALSHNIPYIVFLLFSILMGILCFVKRLSLIPVLGVVCCTYLMTELGITNWIRFGVWLLFGFCVYFLYSYKHSKLHLRDDAAEA